MSNSLSNGGTNASPPPPPTPREVPLTGMPLAWGAGREDV